MLGVKNRVALVTGAGSSTGIGFATAKLLYEAGAKVAITSTTDRIYERLDELTGDKDKSFSKPANLTNVDEVTGLMADIEANLGPIDIVINNAGMVQVGNDETAGAISQMSDESWHYGMDINLTSSFYVTRAVLKGMIERNYGRIVHMSSVTGPVVGIPGSSVYGAAKAGMVGMAKSLAIEVGSHNITVNCIGPGWIKTGSSDEAEIVAGNHTPLGRPGTPDEVGHLAVFLASHEASYITGQLIVVDGGNTIQEYKVEC
jgi:3-oxoacyl-[acyl-carrier protein] reductase